MKLESETKKTASLGEQAIGAGMEVARIAAHTRLQPDAREDGFQNAEAAQAKSVWWVVASLALSVLLSALGTSIAHVGLPTLAAAFGASFQQVQWVVLAYLLAITTLIVSVGRLGDIVGRRRLLLVGLTLFSLASLLCAVAPTLGLLITARAGQGLGAAIMMSLSMAFVGDAVPKARSGSAMGLLGSLSAIGTALGPTLGGVLIAEFGWPSIFYIKVPLSLLALLLVYRCLPVDRPRAEASGPTFDVLGTVVLALTLAAYALAMTIGRGSFGAVNVGLLAAAVAGLVLFIRVESRIASPLVRVAMFRNLYLSAGLAMSALVATVVMATLVMGPFYLTGVFALDAAQVGLVMSCGPLMAALMGVPAGRAVDRFGAPRMSSLGLVAAVVGCLLLSMLPTAAGVLGYVLPLMMVTAGYAQFQAANNTAVMATFSAEQRGVGSGLLNLSRNLGLITGASMMGIVFAHGTGSANLMAAEPLAIVIGMRITFGVAALLVTCALLIARYRD